jgi:hypothetical protein
MLQYHSFTPPERQYDNREDLATLSARVHLPIASFDVLCCIFISLISRVYTSSDVYYCKFIARFARLSCLSRRSFLIDLNNPPRLVMTSEQLVIG